MLEDIYVIIGHADECLKSIINLSLLAGGKQLKKMMDDGTLDNLLKKLDPLNFETLRYKMIRQLLRMRCLDKYRLKGHYLICVDGSGHLTYNHRHCKHCLFKKRHGKILYWYHPVLEAKLICANGLVLSIATEFIENPSPKVKKQNCEKKAFYGLMEKLKNAFPQLPICLLLDGLYDNRKVIALCEKNRWKYIITFREGAMRALYAEYRSLRSLQKENRGYFNWKGADQKYRWALELEYKGHILNVLECKETKKKKKKKWKTKGGQANQKTKEKTKFVWLTNFWIDSENFYIIANKGGRLRWKIENEGFNMQKNGGYALEHAFSEDENSAKNFYLLLQIAHIINQLMELGSLLTEEVKKKFGSIRDFAFRLLEAFRNIVITLQEVLAIESAVFQIRLRGPT